MMPSETSPADLRPLKQALLNEYETFADRRIKNIDRGNLFIADDRGPGDHGADKQLFLWFCTIFVQVTEPNRVKIMLGRAVPRSAAVTAWIKKYAADDAEIGVRFDVTNQDVAKLGELASAMRSIVRPGAPRYPIKAYKYVCPRTAKSLDRLRGVLIAHWGKGKAT